MEKKRGLNITMPEILESVDRSIERQRKGKITRSGPLSETATPLENFGHNILFRLREKGLSIQDLVDKTGYTRDDLIDIRFGSLSLAEVLPKIGKLEEALGYERGELLVEFNDLVGH